MRKMKNAFTLAEGATHVDICNNTRRTAFTLAEVLITLAIIGVVAAMTIPTLIANYQQKSWATSAQVFEKRLQEALKVMNVNATLAGHQTTESFVDELSKHFKITKTCDSNNLNNCIAENVTWNILDISNGGSESETLNLANLKTSADLGKSDWGTETIGVQFANGTSAILAYDPSCKQDPYSNQITGMSCISMLYDVSGFTSPNTTGKDIRGFNNKVSNAAFKLDGKIFGHPSKPEPHVWNACDVNGSSTDPNDLAFMSKYGINKCMTSNNGKSDYWAGAVVNCGGVTKLPTKEQSANLASYIYGMTVSAGSPTYCADYVNCRNNDKALAMGFQFGPNESFSFWTSEESNANYSYVRYIQPSYASYGYHSRSYDNRFYLCVE